MIADPGLRPLRVLACIPHFYDRAKARSSNGLGSGVEAAEQRARTFGEALRRLVSLLADTCLQMGTTGQVAMDEVRTVPRRVVGDVCVCVREDKHILDLVSSGRMIRHRQAGMKARLLGYECRAEFAENLGRYDLYCMIEDDTAIFDPEFFDKVAAFYRRFGEQRLVLPNRYELTGRLDGAWRAYLDDPVPPLYQLDKGVADVETLTSPSYAGEVVFRRTASLYAGCYVVTDGQLRRWMSQDDFYGPMMDLVRQGFDPLEMQQAPLMGSLPAYRPGVENLGFLEVHHLPNRLSALSTPQRRASALIAPELERRAGMRSG